MQFTDNLGISATRDELKAVLTFAGDTNENKVCFRVRNGELLVWASIGGNAIYHKGAAFNADNEGKPFVGSHEWEIDVDTVATIHRMMEAGEEAILETDELGRMPSYRVRDIETSTEKMVGSLDGRVSRQLSFDLGNILVIDRPLEPFGTSEIAWYPSTLKFIDVVGKAVGKGAVAKFQLPNNELGQTHIKIAERKAFIDGDEANWTIVLSAVDLDSERVKSKKVKKELDDYVGGVDRGREKPKKEPQQEPLSFAGKNEERPENDTEEDDDVTKELKKRTKKSSKLAKKPKSKTKSLEDYEESEDA